MQRPRKNPRREGGVVPTKPDDFGRVGWPIEACQNEYTPAVARFMASYDGPGTARHLCIYLNISPATFYDWMEHVPAFAETVTRHRTMTDDAVEEALLSRALGTERKETKIKRKFVLQVKERDEETGVPIEYEEVEAERIKQENIKVFEPNVEAAEFWLTNRRPDGWSKRQVIAHEQSHGDLVDKFFREMQDITPEGQNDVDQ